MAPLLDSPGTFTRYQNGITQKIEDKTGGRQVQIVTGELILAFYNGELCCLVNDRINGHNTIQIPGGKNEEGEEIVMTAARETDEETGLKVSERQSIYGSDIVLIIKPKNKLQDDHPVIAATTVMSYVPNPRSRHFPREEDKGKVSESRWVNLWDMITDINQNPQNYEYNVRLRFKNPRFINELIQYLKQISMANHDKTDSLRNIIAKLHNYARSLET